MRRCGAMHLRHRGASPLCQTSPSCKAVVPRLVPFAPKDHIFTCGCDSTRQYSTWHGPGRSAIGNCANVACRSVKANNALLLAQLYWPDDKKWYLITFHSVNLQDNNAQ